MRLGLLWKGFSANVEGCPPKYLCRLMLMQYLTSRHPTSRPVPATLPNPSDMPDEGRS